MRFRQPCSLPELLTLLSAPNLSPGSCGMGLMPRPGLAPLNQMIRLAREGMREYNRKLDMLEKQVSRRGLDLDRDEFPEKEDPPERSSGADEDCADDDDSGHLTQHQIHHIFEKLAIHRRRLNGRGYAYTSDVNEEQERTYPGCELLTRNKVEES